jgi:hypothetical protein
MTRLEVIESIERLGTFEQVPSTTEGVSLYRMQVTPSRFVYKSINKDEIKYSFLVDGGEGASVEWLAKHGEPFIRWTKCAPDWEGTDEFDRPIKAKPHWHYEHIKPFTCNWTYSGAENAGICRLLDLQLWDVVFGCLECWL